MVITELDRVRTIDLESKRRLEKALRHLQNGKGIILMDDEDRENEGDMIYSAHNMTNEQMALMIRKCSGKMEKKIPVISPLKISLQLNSSVSSQSSLHRKAFR